MRLEQQHLIINMYVFSSYISIHKTSGCIVTRAMVSTVGIVGGKQLISQSHVNQAVLLEQH
jgi:hypothetical protein